VRGRRSDPWIPIRRIGKVKHQGLQPTEEVGQEPGSGGDERDEGSDRVAVVFPPHPSGLPVITGVVILQLERRLEASLQLRGGHVSLITSGDGVAGDGGLADEELVQRNTIVVDLLDGSVLIRTRLGLGDDMAASGVHGVLVVVLEVVEIDGFGVVKLDIEVGSLGVSVLVVGEPGSDGCGRDEEIFTEILAESRVEVLEPLNSFPVVESVKVLVIDIDTIEPVSLSKLGDLGGIVVLALYDDCIVISLPFYSFIPSFLYIAK